MNGACDMAINLDASGRIDRRAFHGLAGFVSQHDGDAVADRVGQLVDVADQFVVGAVVLQRGQTRISSRRLSMAVEAPWRLLRG